MFFSLIFFLIGIFGSLFQGFSYKIVIGTIIYILDVIFFLAHFFLTKKKCVKHNSNIYNYNNVKLALPSYNNTSNTVVFLTFNEILKFFISYWDSVKFSISAIIFFLQKKNKCEGLNYLVNKLPNYIYNLG